MSEMSSSAAVTGGAVTILSVMKDFGTFRAVDNVSLKIRSNEFFTLLGPSGCGKTTLLRMLAGFESPSDGKILLDNRDISILAPNQRPINTVFQNYALFPHMTVAENIGFGLKMLGRSKAEVAVTVEEMLKLVRLEGAGNRSVTELSGGQQQRIALARALAPRPKLLLLDEPLSALDLKLRKSMQIELKRLQEETEITFIFVTHDQEEALTMSDRIAVMNKGHVLQVGTAHEIYEHPADRFVADFIGDTNFLEGNLVSSDGDSSAVALDCGITVDALTAKSVATSGAVTIAVRPEHLEVVAVGSPQSVDATVEHIVYFGTDTHVHAKLADGTKLTIRQQNRPGAKAGADQGMRIGVTIPPRVAQVLKD
jgi:spermidine/putrescine transport system ATP-binding protein